MSRRLISQLNHTARALLVTAGLALCSSSAVAQLGPSQVLVVYDSRSSDGKAVAEWYAGSVKVPGGVGNIKGKYPTVQVFDLASGGVPLSAVGNISYANFVANIRNPIRTYLTSASLQKTIRCIVTTKGMPHRILDTDLPNAGDSPGDQANELNNGDATAASVDSELTLLWQLLDTNENGAAGDSRSDGCIPNPFWKSTVSIAQFPTTNILTAKTFSKPLGFSGIYWTLGGTGATKLNAGDIYLVSRLDGKTVPDVKGLIDRGGAITVNTNTAAFIFDEANSDPNVSDGVANASPNNEWDNNSLAGTIFWSGDDFEKTRDYVKADKRFDPAKVYYDSASGVSRFIVGPLINYQGQGILVSDPVIFLSSWGSNCGPQATQPQTSAGVNAGSNYTKSFNLARGACFTSVESYNARDFGGYGSWFGGWGPQAQISDFVEAGGTFAIGNCWEPFTFPLPDNEWIVKNFYLGQMTWAEAAWSAIPVLSWQTIVVGDPLSRIQRSCEDVNNDGRVDSEDLIWWTQHPTDINRDSVANQTDYQMIEQTVRWTENSYTRDH